MLRINHEVQILIARELISCFYLERIIAGGLLSNSAQTEDAVSIPSLWPLQEIPPEHVSLHEAAITDSFVSNNCATSLGLRANLFGVVVYSLEAQFSGYNSRGLRCSWGGRRGR